MFRMTPPRPASTHESAVGSADSNPNEYFKFSGDEATQSCGTMTDFPSRCVYVQAIGDARIAIGSVKLGFHSEMLFALTLRLVFTPGMCASRATLCNELWPKQPEVRRRGNLRQAIYKLRTYGLRITTVGDLVQMDATQIAPTFSVERTTERFQSDVIDGASPFGVFVPGFEAPSEEMQDWFEATRETVHADVRRVLVEQLRRRRERADWSGADQLARWLLQLDPLNEDATLTLAECAMVAGAKAEAVSILDQYLAELGPNAGDIRLPATQLRKRFAEPAPRRRASIAVAEQPVVGRDAELTMLTLTLRRARWHDGSAVLLHGPPGIGKSRLLTELSRVAQIEGYYELNLECREDENHRPLGVFLDTLPELIERPGALGCAPESLSVLRRLLGENSHSKTSEETSDVNSTLQALRARSIRLAFIDLFAALSEERPILLAVDDAHWLDSHSWDLLCDLIERLSTMRIFAALTSRYSSALARPGARIPAQLRVTSVAPLVEESCRLLVREVADALVAHPTPDIVDWIVQACEGNPMMVRELTEHWSVTGESGGVPPTLAKIISQRLDSLTPTVARAVQVITLMGSYASLERVKDVLALPTRELLEVLEQLEFHGFLARKDVSTIACHDLIGQVACNRLSSLGKAALRKAIADSLVREFEQIGDVRMLVEALVHLRDGATPETLLAFLERHESALLRSGHPQSVLDTIGRVTMSGVRPQHGRLLSRLTARLEADCGEFERSFKTLSAMDVNLFADDCVSQAHVLEQLSFIDSAYRLDPIVDRAQLGALAARISGDERVDWNLRIRASDIGLIIASNLCDENLAIECFSALRLSKRELFDTGTLQRLGILFHAPFGELEVARDLAVVIMKRIEADPSDTNGIVELSRAGFVFRMLGEANLANAAFSTAIDAAFASDVPRLAEYPLWQLAVSALDVGDLAKAGALTSRLLSLVAPTSGSAASYYIDAHLCLLSLETGQIAEARRHFEQFERCLPKIAPTRAIAYSMGLTLAIELADDSWAPSEPLLNTATERFRATSKFAGSDLLAAGVVMSHARLSRLEDAAALLKRYLKVDRRERSAPNARLRRAIEQLEAVS